MLLSGAGAIGSYIYQLTETIMALRNLILVKAWCARTGAELGSAARATGCAAIAGISCNE
jgi:hypothetical protein